jgi:hypothetical protein
MEKQDCIARLVAEDAYIPLADVSIPCDVGRIREIAVGLLTNEEHAVERQIIFTLAQEKAVGCTAFAYLLAEGDVAVLKSTTWEGYTLLREAAYAPPAKRRRLAAKAARACNTLLRANFAFQPARRGRGTRVVASTVQSRLLLAYLPLEPLRSTAISQSVAEAVVDFAIGLRQRAVSAYLRGGTPAEVLHILMDYARGASKQLVDAGFSIPAIADHIYDEVMYTHRYLRRYGFL